MKPDVAERIAGMAAEQVKVEKISPGAPGRNVRKRQNTNVVCAIWETRIAIPYLGTTAVDISPNGELAAVGAWNPYRTRDNEPYGIFYVISLRDRTSDQVRAVLLPHSPKAMRFDPSGGNIDVAVSNRCERYAVDHGQIQYSRHIDGPGSIIEHIAHSAGGDYLAWSCINGEVNCRGLTEPDGKEEIRIVEPQRADALAFAPGDRALLIGVGEDVSFPSHMREHEKVTALPYHTMVDTQQIAFSPDGNRMATVDDKARRLVLAGRSSGSKSMSIRPTLGRYQACPGKFESLALDFCSDGSSVVAMMANNGGAGELYVCHSEPSGPSNINDTDIFPFAKRLNAASVRGDTIVIGDAEGVDVLKLIYRP